MEESLLNRIEINPKIMFGKPVIKGTRLTLEIILEKLAYGQTEEQRLDLSHRFTQNGTDKHRLSGF